MKNIAKSIIAAFTILLLIFACSCSKTDDEEPAVNINSEKNTDVADDAEDTKKPSDNTDDIDSGIIDNEDIKNPSDDTDDIADDTKENQNTVNVVDGTIQLKNVTPEYNKYIGESAKTKTYKREGAPLKRSFKEKVTVEYKETNQSGAVAPVDIYTDASGSIYYYNSDGALFTFVNKADNMLDADVSVSKDPKKVVTKEKAIEIAENFAKENFGDLYNGYELSSVIGDYCFTFAKKCGSDNYIIAQTYTCDVSPSGKINLCSISNPQNFEGFDADVFKDVSKADIEKAATAAIKETFSDRFIACSLKGAYIGKYNDNYIIKAAYNVTLTTDDSQMEMAYEVILQP